MPRKLKLDDIHHKLEYHFDKILQLMGCDTKNDANYIETPKRVANIFMEEIYPIKPTKKLVSMFPNEEGKGQMVILKNHEVWSRCPHHLERVKFSVNIGYIPDKWYLGASKLARIANYYAHGMVLQETFTNNISEGIMEAIKPKGVAVSVKGIHQCMRCRGIKTQGHIVTSAVSGLFLEKPEVREEFMFLCAHNN